VLAVVTDDLKALSRAQGIGAKAAGRIALELKSKLRASAETDGTSISNQVGFQTVSGPKQDAIDALTSLGYGRGEAVRAVMEVYLPELNVEQIIKLSLKKLT
jgi:Holliday junction DNA helicase RuvA